VLCAVANFPLNGLFLPQNADPFEAITATNKQTNSQSIKQSIYLQNSRLSVRQESIELAARINKLYSPEINNIIKKTSE